MAKHDIWMRIPRVDIVNADVEFEVYSDDEKLGELHLSKGTVDWWPANAKSARSVTWEQFADWMDGRRD